MMAGSSCAMFCRLVSALEYILVMTFSKDAGGVLYANLPPSITSSSANSGVGGVALGPSSNQGLTLVHYSLFSST